MIDDVFRFNLSHAAISCARFAASVYTSKCVRGPSFQKPSRSSNIPAVNPSDMPDPSDKLSISSLCCAIFYLNAKLGEGNGAHITFDDVYREIDSSTLWPFLERELGESTLDFLRPGVHEQATLFAEAMRDAGTDPANLGLDSRKHNGVCLVIALIAELIQQGRWNIGSLDLYDTRG